MAHTKPHPSSRTRGRKTAAFLSILLFIPLVCAGYFLFTIYSSNLNQNTVTEIVLTHDEGTVLLQEKEAIVRTMKAIDNAKKITQSARPLSEYRAVGLVCSDAFTSASYTLYLSESATDALVATEEETLCSITPEDALELLCAEEYSFLYQTAPDVMQMTVGETVYTVEPTYTWHYFTADGTEKETSSAPQMMTYTASGVLPSFTVPGEPDEMKLSVTVGSDVKVGTLSEFSALLPAAGGSAEVSVSATWSNPDADGFYGTAQYRFLLNYTPEA